AFPPMKHPVKIQPADTFAAIGALRQARRDAQLQPATIGPLPDKALPRLRSGARHAFAPAPRLATPADLTRALREERMRMAPFLRALAPRLASPRHRQVLRDFGWRVATRDDCTGFHAAKSGHGAWQRITLPHYGPPTGRALAWYRTTFTLS